MTIASLECPTLLPLFSGFGDYRHAPYAWPKKLCSIFAFAFDNFLVAKKNWTVTLHYVLQMPSEK